MSTREERVARSQAMPEALLLNGGTVRVQVIGQAPSARSIKGGGRYLWAIPSDPTDAMFVGLILVAEHKAEPGVYRQVEVPVRWRLEHRQMMSPTVRVPASELQPGDTFTTDCGVSSSFCQANAGFIVTSVKPEQVNYGGRVGTQPRIKVTSPYGDTLHLEPTATIRVIREGASA